MLPEYPWAEQIGCAVTICDADCNIIYMNARSRATFEKDDKSLIGANLMECHPPHAQEKIRHLLQSGETNAYTILKNGIKKLIYQTPWHNAEGKIAGLVEFSIPLPDDMPHYIR